MPEFVWRVCRQEADKRQKPGRARLMFDPGDVDASFIAAFFEAKVSTRRLPAGLWVCAEGRRTDRVCMQSGTAAL